MTITVCTLSLSLIESCTYVFTSPSIYSHNTMCVYIYIYLFLLLLYFSPAQVKRCENVNKQRAEKRTCPFYRSIATGLFILSVTPTVTCCYYRCFFYLWDNKEKRKPFSVINSSVTWSAMPYTPSFSRDTGSNKERKNPRIRPKKILLILL